MGGGKCRKCGCTQYDCDFWQGGKDVLMGF